ncbi:HEAT repeats [Armatimonadetes bacterium DC]|jgi:hypothetical protein|nr:HEAT repeats [Armatimonadetes bacterium GXS]CUU38255.1 HEAT repeats [Armatimonadetes bacterium DC]
MNTIPDNRLQETEDAHVVNALRKQAGMKVTSVWDLVNMKVPYPEAIPVLLEWLPKVRHPKVKEGIVRALTVKEARGVAGKFLVEEFLRVDAPSQEPRFAHIPRGRYGEWLQEPTLEERYLVWLWHLKWAIGNALGYVADASVIHDVIALLRDRRHGGTRSQLVWALVRLCPPETEAVVLELLDDEDDGVAIQAALAAGRLGLQSAREKIAQRFLNHRDSWMRQQAKRALAKLDRARSQAKRE